MNIHHCRPKFVAITAAVVLAATSYGFGAVLSVPQYNQEKDQWCWAASSQMILAFKGYSCSQTEIANWAVGGQNIPNYLFNSPDPSMKGCDEVLAHFGSIDSSGTLAAISLSALNTEMANSSPVMIGVLWDGGGGHAILLRGTDGDYVYVNDPWPDNGQSVQTYDGVLRYLGNGTWDQTLRLNAGGSDDDDYARYEYYYNLAYGYYSNYQSTGSYLDLTYCYYYYAYAMYYYYTYYGDSSSASYYYDYYMQYAQYYYDLYNYYYQSYAYYYNLAYYYYVNATSYLDYAYCYYYYAYAVYYYYMAYSNSSYADYYYDYYMYWAYYYYYLYYG